MSLSKTFLPRSYMIADTNLKLAGVLEAFRLGFVADVTKIGGAYDIEALDEQSLIDMMASFSLLDLYNSLPNYYHGSPTNSLGVPYTSPLDKVKFMRSFLKELLRLRKDVGTFELFDLVLGILGVKTDKFVVIQDFMFYDASEDTYTVQPRAVYVSRYVGTADYESATGKLVWTSGDLFWGFRPGEIVKYDGTDYVISSVADLKNIVLSSGPAENVYGAKFLKYMLDPTIYYLSPPPCSELFPSEVSGFEGDRLDPTNTLTVDILSAVDATIASEFVEAVRNIVFFLKPTYVIFKDIILATYISTDMFYNMTMSQRGQRVNPSPAEGSRAPAPDYSFSYSALCSAVHATNRITTVAPYDFTIHFRPGMLLSTNGFADPLNVVINARIIDVAPTYIELDVDDEWLVNEGPTPVLLRGDYDHSFQDGLVPTALSVNKVGVFSVDATGSYIERNDAVPGSVGFDVDGFHLGAQVLVSGFTNDKNNVRELKAALITLVTNSKLYLSVTAASLVTEAVVAQDVTIEMVEPYGMARQNSFLPKPFLEDRSETRHPVIHQPGPLPVVAHRGSYMLPSASSRLGRLDTEHLNNLAPHIGGTIWFGDVPLPPSSDERYWRGAGNWSDGSKWSYFPDVFVAAPVPTGSDSVIFDAASSNCTLDVNAICRSINTTGYLATLDFNDFDIDVGYGGTFTAGTIRGGSGTLSFGIGTGGGTVTFDGCTFVSETSTVLCSASVTEFVGGLQEFYNLTFDDHHLVPCDIAKSANSGLTWTNVLTCDKLRVNDTDNNDATRRWTWTGNVSTAPFVITGDVTKAGTNTWWLTFKPTGLTGNLSFDLSAISASGALKLQLEGTSDTFYAEACLTGTSTFDILYIDSQNGEARWTPDSSCGLTLTNTGNCLETNTGGAYDAVVSAGANTYTTLLGSLLASAAKSKINQNASRWVFSRDVTIVDGGWTKNAVSDIYIELTGSGKVITGDNDYGKIVVSGTYTAASNITASKSAWVDYSLYVSNVAYSLNMAGFDLTVVGPIRSNGTLNISSSTFTHTGDVLFLSGALTCNTSTIIISKTGGADIEVDTLTDISVGEWSMDATSTTGSISIWQGIKCVTSNLYPSNKVYFKDGKLFEVDTINWDGDITGSIVLDHWGGGAHWLLKCNEAMPVVTYVNVAWSDASPGNAIHAFDGTSVDSGDNIDWLFVRDEVYRPTLGLAGGPSGSYSDIFSPFDGESGVLTVSDYNGYYNPSYGFIAVDASTLTYPPPAQVLGANPPISITTKTYTYSRSGSVVTVTPDSGEPTGLHVAGVGLFIRIGLTDSYNVNKDNPQGPPFNIPPYVGSYPTAELMTDHLIDLAFPEVHAVSS